MLQQLQQLEHYNNYLLELYHKVLHLGCCSSNRSASENDHCSTQPNTTKTVKLKVIARKWKNE